MAKDFKGFSVSYTDILTREYVPWNRTKYTPETLWQKAYDYFVYMNGRCWTKLDAIKGGDRAGDLIEIPIPTPYSLETFCTFAHIGTATWALYCKNEEYGEEMHEVCARIKGIVDSQHFEGGMTNIYHAGLAARKLGLADKQDITSGGDKIAPPVIVFKKTLE